MSDTSYWEVSLLGIVGICRYLTCIFHSNSSDEPLGEPSQVRIEDNFLSQERSQFSALKHGRSRCSFGLAAGCRKHHRASGLGLRAKTLNIRLRCFKSSESLKPILRRLHSSWSFCSRDFHPSVHCTNI